MMKAPQPNYQFLVDAVQNKKPERMPVYEHAIDPGFIEKATGIPMTQLLCGNTGDRRAYIRHLVDFWQNNGYDTVSFTMGIPLACPGSGALRLHTPPVLCTPEDVAEKCRPGDVLVVPYTTNSMLPYIRQAAAVISEEASTDSHTATIGLTLDKPVIVGAVGATRRLTDGVMVTVDCVRGVVQTLPQ